MVLDVWGPRGPTCAVAAPASNGMTNAPVNANRVNAIRLIINSLDAARPFR
jgi:hypothetical protein